MVMFAAYAARIDRDQPLNGLELGERPAPETAAGLDAPSTSRPPRSTTTTCGRCAASASPRTSCR